MKIEYALQHYILAACTFALSALPKVDEREDQIELLHAELRAYGSNSGQSGIPTQRDFDKLSFGLKVSDTG